ncbi:MAG TPA: hypothetical protein VI636_09790 [Candidatus Angelobacter sp.]
MNNVIWRDAVQADLPSILELWNEQEERFAESSVRVDRPQLFWEQNETRPPGWRYRPPIMRLRVAEKDGPPRRIVGFRYVEAVPEVCLVTGDEDVMKTLGKELTEECHLFKSLGFRSGWGLVPEKFAKALARFTRYSPVRLWKNLRLIGCDFSELGD